MATSYFLKSTKFPGEAKDEGHANEIKLLSWSFGFNNQANIGGSSGASGGTVNVQDFHITRETDASTPKILKALSTGASEDEMTFTAVKSTGSGNPEVFLEIVFKEIYVTSHSIGGSEGSESVPMETISFAFGSIKTDYKMQGEGGTLTTAGEHTYDQRTKVTS